MTKSISNAVSTLEQYQPSVLSTDDIGSLGWCSMWYGCWYVLFVLFSFWSSEVLYLARKMKSRVMYMFVRGYRYCPVFLPLFLRQGDNCCVSTSFFDRVVIVVFLPLFLRQGGNCCVSTTVSLTGWSLLCFYHCFFDRVVIVVFHFITGQIQSVVIFNGIYD